MKRVLPRLVLLVCAVAYFAYQWRSESFDEIHYRGEKFKLTRSYSSYDDFKEDPNALAPAEKAHLESVMTQPLVPTTFSDRKSIVKAVFRFRFPGSGSASMGETRQPDGSSLSGFSVEMPLGNKSRYFIFSSKSGTYKLADDFFYADDELIERVEEKNGEFIYSTLEGKKLLTRPSKNTAAAPATAIPPPAAPTPPPAH